MSEGSKECWRLSCHFLAAYKFEGCCLQIFAQLLTNFRPAAYKFSPSCWEISSGVRSRTKIRQATKGSRSSSCDFLAAYKFHGCCLQIFANLLTNFRAAAYKFSACCLQILGHVRTGSKRTHNSCIFIGREKSAPLQCTPMVSDPNSDRNSDRKFPQKSNLLRKQWTSKNAKIERLGSFDPLSDMEFSIRTKHINRSAVFAHASFCT